MKLEVITREPETDARPTPVLFVHGMFHGAWCWDEHFLPYFARMQDESYRAYIEMIFLGLRPPSQIVDTPLLVLGGANDAAISPGEVEATAHRHNTQAEFFPNIAHDMMLESSWQAVADRILGWIGKQGM